MDEHLHRLLRDAALQDLPEHSTTRDLELALAQTEHRALRFHLTFFDGSRLDVDALLHWTVRSLQQTIEQRIATRAGLARISWKKVWKTWWLASGETVLRDAGRTLEASGLTRSCELHWFSRKDQELRLKRHTKTRVKQQPRRQHRKL
ncbi:hypothetical protein Poli38472_003370 [Pythium oligandrum]|uniref:SNRNP25 ubiquitin-like domain-containing protein n=1 Tax=Pythium oligandrum TaxID=41045 RepID=A0A8K1C6P4_PYTOL|nr:hypothetical protein Poli38472_003370 [Pythium oligandrum]|eukprot:TMW57445.1 hypothetical protein Poli38472_003370 [Pythium oligandrum]